MWENIFGVQINALLEQYSNTLTNTIRDFLNRMAQEASILGATDKCTRLNASLLASVQRIAQSAVIALREQVQGQQREISRLIVPSIQENRAPMYALLAAEHGTGTVERMRASFKSAAETEFDSMYRSASRLLEQELVTLFKTMHSKCFELQHRLLEEVRVQVGGLWEDGGGSAVNRDQIRADLSPKLTALITDFQRALQSLNHLILRDESFLDAVEQPPPAQPLDGHSSAPAALDVVMLGKRLERGDPADTAVPAPVSPMKKSRIDDDANAGNDE